MVPTFQLKRDHKKEFKKQDSTICSLQETHFKYKDTTRLKVKGWIKIYHDNTS